MTFYTYLTTVAPKSRVSGTQGSGKHEDKKLSIKSDASIRIRSEGENEKKTESGAKSEVGEMWDDDFYLEEPSIGESNFDTQSKIGNDAKQENEVMAKQNVGNKNVKKSSQKQIKHPSHGLEHMNSSQRPNYTSINKGSKTNVSDVSLSSVEKQKHESSKDDKKKNNDDLKMSDELNGYAIADNRESTDYNFKDESNDKQKVTTTKTKKEENLKLKLDIIKDDKLDVVIPPDSGHRWHRKGLNEVPDVARLVRPFGWIENKAAVAEEIRQSK